MNITFRQKYTMEYTMNLNTEMKDGKPLKGSTVIKDTLNLKPGKEYVVAFEANNEGNWMFHCHDLHHASADMVTELKYTDYKTDFVPDPNAGNKPE
ncbi:hypothetical protein B1222_01425 [Paenibacillus larvae subsp. pulvifaciens]|nr:hypothetical protein B1222_01425 [Paenibacillus larvae subsp. pulvifaciens]MBH0342179.1 hypothetical protein [Paenibacillus larvae]